ncbi:hypothetical protein HDU81_007057 [Chytriomyces hyalinus]|nr:hypothetical protein HDU81_007057 [Chytriomyces hyalinus]
MLLSSLVLAAATAVSSVSALANPPVTDGKVVGGYVLFGDPVKLKLLADNASNLPVNRVWLSFVRPDLYYEPGSNTLVGVGLNYNNTQADYGFAEIKQYVQKLQAGGVEVFLAMGGWDYNCWPWSYAYYSIYNYGSTTPTYQSTIQKYANGQIGGCNEGNQFCYACEPPSNGNTFDSFTIFPEPANSATWKQAQDYVTKNSKMPEAPVWHPELVGGAKYTTEKNGVVTVPGSNVWAQKGRDPYQDLVYVAKDLGLDGVDIDYEEFWHADMFKTDTSAQKNCGNGCTLYQTVYKFSAIMENMRINIKNIYPSLKLSTAASAAGAWAGTWWGGNHKGLTLNMVPSYPDLVAFVGTGANAGGWNIMTYDLSNSTVNCPPAPATCSLDGQVNFYMAQYTAAGVVANVGYEIGTPAYPPPAIDAAHSMPLTNSLAGAIISNTQPYYKGGFFWELFKPQASPSDIHVTTLARALCKAVLGANTPRCSGSIPILVNDVLPGSSDTVPVGPPGPAPSGPPPCADPYSPTQQYTNGMKFSYNGYNYACTYWVPAGTQPGQPGLPQQGLCAPTGVVTSTIAPASSTSATPASSAVKSTTSAVVTTAQPSSSAAQTSSPAATSAKPTTTGASGVPCTTAWVSGTAYSGGAQVSNKGFNWAANWWTNTEPSTSDASWKQVSACGSGPAPSSSAVPPASSSVVVPSTSAKPITSSAAPATTSAAAGGNIFNGASCTVFGERACSNQCQCSYVIVNGAYALQYQCTPASARC